MNKSKKVENLIERRAMRSFKDFFDLAFSDPVLLQHIIMTNGYCEEAYPEEVNAIYLVGLISGILCHDRAPKMLLVEALAEIHADVIQHSKIAPQDVLGPNRIYFKTGVYKCTKS